MIDLDKIDPAKPVLIFGPTASGKSGLALRIAQAQGGVIVNADALQVYRDWPILSAQPPTSELEQVSHHLYGHLPGDRPYSVGDWLREVSPYLDGPRPIIVGGTGLYFTALTEGLAEIPPTPPQVRAEGDATALPDLIAALDPATAAAIDLNNRARVQRAWEVQRATGRSIRDWQANTPAPLLPLSACTPLALFPDVDWLNRRIAQRFDQMMDQGALDEARSMLPAWDPSAPSSKAIGAVEMIQLLEGEISTDSARERIIIATRQYAKRQRTWLRSRMKRWQVIPLPDMDANKLTTK